MGGESRSLQSMWTQMLLGGEMWHGNLWRFLLIASVFSVRSEAGLSTEDRRRLY